MELNKGLCFDEYAKKTNPVFIFGMNRGGTTLTYHIMKFHPQIVKLPVNSYFFRHFWELRKKIPVKALHKIFLVSSGFYNSELDDELSKFLSRHFFNLMKNKDGKEMFNFTSYIAYCQQKEKHNVKWWAERTNNHMFYYRILKKWFPLCKFIICVRDPRAVITSALGAVGAKRRDNSPSFIIKYCQNYSFRWLDKAGRTLAMKKHFKDDVFISKYEDFVKEPINHINRLWRFLNLPAMGEKDLKDKIDSLGAIYVSKVGVKRTTGIDTASVEKWRQVLSPTAQRIIEDITSGTAKKLGYDFEKSFLRFSYLSKQPQETFINYPKRILSLPRTITRSVLLSLLDKSELKNK